MIIKALVSFNLLFKIISKQLHQRQYLTDKLTNSAKGNPKTSPEDRPPLCSSVLQLFHPSQLSSCWWNNYRTHVPYSYLTSSSLAENAEMVAAQKNIEAGDLLGKSWDCLLSVRPLILLTA